MPDVDEHDEPDDLRPNGAAGLTGGGLAGDGVAGAGPSGGVPPEARAVGMCDDALAELYTFLDGELTEGKRDEIRHHLDDCSPCLEVYDFEAELRLVIRQRCREQVPEALRQRVAERLAGLAAEGAAAPSTETSSGSDASG